MDLQRFARIVIARREELGLTQDEVHQNGGPTDTTLGKIENAEWQPGNRKTTLRKLDKGLRWQEGSAKCALEGGDPIPLDVVAIRERLQDEVYRTRFELFDLRDQRYEKPMAEWTDRDLDAEDEMEIRLHATEAEIRMLDASVRNAAENRLIDLVQDGQVLAARRSDAELNAYVRQVESAVVGMVGFARVNEELAARQPVPGIEQRLAGDPKPGAGRDQAHGG